ncbi:hypothetical protein [Aliidiomarina celeris]|uniref:hypothetical protein n=1 Tax=Aliidiomarina celeris TaxID=2249428 RepID=UPI000DE8D286|nr:hypothetical protein [Aliidiomarina celeris]
MEHPIKIFRFNFFIPALALLLLVGCIGDSSEDDANSDVVLALTPHFSAELLPENARVLDYVTQHGVELLYGERFFATRVNEGEWQVEASDAMFVFGADIISSDHWILSAAFDGSYDDDLATGHYLHETLSHEEFPSAVAKRLILDPYRDGIWWIGRVELATGGGETPPDARVMRYDFSGNTVEVDDFTSRLGFSHTTGGLVHSNDPNAVYVAGSVGIQRTEDSGVIWDHAFSSGNVPNIVQSESGNRLYVAYRTQFRLEVACSETMGDIWRFTMSEDIPESVRVTLVERFEDNLVIGFSTNNLYSISLNQIPCEPIF